MKSITAPPALLAPLLLPPLSPARLSTFRPSPFSSPPCHPSWLGMELRVRFECGITIRRRSPPIPRLCEISLCEISFETNTSHRRGAIHTNHTRFQSQSALQRRRGCECLETGFRCKNVCMIMKWECGTGRSVIEVQVSMEEQGALEPVRSFIVLP